jgi:excisionase family DNA binding protein
MPYKEVAAPTTKRVAYTIGEVAAMTGRDRTTVWRWLKRGVLKPVKIPGSKNLVSAASLDRLISQ